MHIRLIQQEYCKAGRVCARQVGFTEAGRTSCRVSSVSTGVLGSGLGFDFCPFAPLRFFLCAGLLEQQKNVIISNRQMISF